ncbi:EmrB/QacA subfamily drug resistance transporter [Allocatelliglobosispora scoriae]|uniref:EmrB/QacA subfamily drug resistance transporter n=1 Tax=Allocatelliglobosispora scoriae TaxID=643052 RepID=A0A841BYN5_9ACTN|nr:EmrB/QacA subfamily drug resistance transporter [Allocatelliglobosispora scoriae]
MPRPNLKVVLPGLMLAMVLAMLDNMVVGTAMPKIVGELGGLSKLSWVVTAYVLGTTVSTPIWGKLGDLYGRKKIFLTSILLFLIGSMLSGAAGEFTWLNDQITPMTQLIAFRAFQGIGAGGLMVGAFAIIGDLVPPRERGKYQGLMGGIMAIAMIAGPLVGGLITDNYSWRWIFYMNIPLGVAAFFILVSFLHLPTKRTEHRIDWLGAGLLGVGITALVLITTWAGKKSPDGYAWVSPQILGLAGLAIVTLAIFILVQLRVPEPILPLHIFKNRNFSLVSGIGFMVGFALFGAVAFLPLYQQTVQGASATNSGLLLLPMMLGVMTTSFIIGTAITKTGKYRWYPIIGGVVMTLAMFLLTRLDDHTSKTESTVYFVILGLGMGFLMQTTLLIAQNSVEMKDLGVASSTATFVRSIGGSFGVSIFGAVFTSRLKSDIGASLGPQAAAQVDKVGGNLQADQLAAMPAPVREGFLHAIAFATSGLFWWALAFAVMVPVLAWFIKEVPLRSGADNKDADGAEIRPLVAVE